MTGLQSEYTPLPSSTDGSILLLTSLDEGAGVTSYRSVFGPASMRMHLQPLCHAAENLGLKSRVLSLTLITLVF